MNVKVQLITYFQKIKNLIIITIEKTEQLQKLLFRRKKTLTIEKLLNYQGTVGAIGTRFARIKKPLETKKLLVVELGRSQL